MSDHDALLAAILASPDDDLPRLVFADWLEESGQPANAARAQFIRLQVEAAHHPDGSVEALRLVRAAAAHRGSFADEADAVFATSQGRTWVVAIRRRGFVDEVRGPSRYVLPTCAGLFAAAPVRLLDLDTPSDPFAGTGRQPAWLGRLRELKLRIQRAAHVDATRAVAESRWLIGLTTLDLSGNAMLDEWVIGFVRRFGRAAFAGTLRTLDLSRNWITDAGASALSAAAGLDQLVVLRLAQNRITPAGAALLRRRFGDRVAV